MAWALPGSSKLRESKEAGLVGVQGLRVSLPSVLQDPGKPISSRRLGQAEF